MFYSVNTQRPSVVVFAQIGYNKRAHQRMTRPIYFLWMYKPCFEITAVYTHLPTAFLTS